MLKILQKLKIKKIYEHDKNSKSSIGTYIDTHAKKLTNKLIDKRKLHTRKKNNSNSGNSNSGNSKSNKQKQIRKSSLKLSQNFSIYKPPINKTQVHPKIWELPNRKNFYNWVIDTFQQYETGNTKKLVIEKPQNTEQMELNNIQRLTRDYLQGESPVRGLLLYIGLGAGKTCAAITISESILTKKEVIILSKTSLETNFRKEFRNCGSDYVKTANYWVFSKCDNDEEHKLAIGLGIPEISISENKGAFFVDFSKTESNFKTLSNEERKKLDNQIEHIVNNRFTFIHYDSPTKWSKLKEGSFDNKIIIVDEIHNIGNTMASTTSDSADKFYNLFMNAKNPKLIFLSGTPIINNIYEITKIFNILRGYMPYLEIRIISTYDTPIDYKNIKYMLKKNPHVDQIVINTARKIITVSKNPDNFVTHASGKGIIYKPDESISFEDFNTEITKLIKQLGYKTSVSSIENETCFNYPDKASFEKDFYNADLNKLKKTELIKRRIAGLTTYYEYQDKSNYPELLNIHKIQIPMSDFQFSSYERYRHSEIQKEKFDKRKTDEDTKLQQSDYRIKSRLACTFVFPNEIGSPYDSKVLEDNIKLYEKLGNLLDNTEITEEEINDMNAKTLKTEIWSNYIELLNRDKHKYLDMKNGSLKMYSPKYYSMITNIQKNQHGKLLVYSYFRNLIGLETFSYALQQTNNWAPLRIKKTNSTGGKATKRDTVWVLEELEEDKGKNKFVFYVGGQDPVLREIYRNIYNSTWEQLPPETCSKLILQLKTIHKNNYYGEVVKMLMTTKTGAEGLDLKEVRYIHIMEPYWQHVLIDQIIGRGVRNKSHLSLEPADRNVEVYIYMATITSTQIRASNYIEVRTDTYKAPNPALTDKAFKVVSSDEYLYLISERKRIIINEFQKLMKESAFDCALNYKDNMRNPANKGLICMDYASKDRDDYLFTPRGEDTEDSVVLSQEKVVVEQYGKKIINDKECYFNMAPGPNGKMYIYDDSVIGRIRLPKPIGEVTIVNGKRRFGLFRVIKNKKHKK